MRYNFDAERLAYWYLRLNGFLTIENFILHDEKADRQRTDIDLVALRFPHRREAWREDDGGFMDDDPLFAGKETLFAAFVEVTTGQCKLNGPWTVKNKGNLPRALRALGAVPLCEVDNVAGSLYETGLYKSCSIEIGLIAIGSQKNATLTKRIPRVTQILWADIKGFIFERFEKYERIKRQRPQWDPDGHLLWKVFQENKGDPGGFALSLVLFNESPDLEKFYQSRVIPG